MRATSTAHSARQYMRAGRLTAVPMNAPQKSKHLTWRHRIYEVLDHDPVGDRREQFVSWFLIVLVLVNVGAIVFESVPRYEAAHQALFIGIEIFSLLVFTAE